CSQCGMRRLASSEAHPMARSPMPDSTIIPTSLSKVLARVRGETAPGHLFPGQLAPGLLARRRYRVVRPDDLLVLEFMLHNLEVADGRLQRIDASDPGVL